MTYQQYLDYISIRNAINAYNSAYASVVIHLQTPDGVVEIPVPSSDKAKIVIHSEQFRKDYPTHTDVTIVGDCLIQALPAINTILNIPSDVFTSRIQHLVKHTALDLFSPVTLTEPQFNYLKSGDTSVLGSNH